MPNISISLSMEAIKKLDSESWELHKSKSSFIEKLIMDYKKGGQHGSNRKQPAQ
jgi:hypothetical protein